MARVRPAMICSMAESRTVGTPSVRAKSLPVPRGNTARAALQSVWANPFTTSIQSSVAARRHDHIEIRCFSGKFFRVAGALANADALRVKAAQPSWVAATSLTAPAIGLRITACSHRNGRVDRINRIYMMVLGILHHPVNRVCLPARTLSLPRESFGWLISALHGERPIRIIKRRLQRFGRSGDFVVVSTEGRGRKTLHRIAVTSWQAATGGDCARSARLFLYAGASIGGGLR